MNMQMSVLQLKWTTRLIIAFFLLISFVAVFAMPPTHAHAATVVTYPQIPGVNVSGVFSIQVNGQNSPAYIANGSPTPTFTTFSTDGAVTVDVKDLQGSVSSAVVRPTSYGITPAIRNGNTVEFTMNPLQKVSVEVNGDITNNVALIFADPPETNVPSGSNVVSYTTPGVYNLGSGWCFPSGKNTLYIAGGVYLKGTISCKNLSNVSILGRGILAGDGSSIPNEFDGSIAIENSSGVTIDGLTLINAAQDCCGQGYGLTLWGSSGDTVNDIALINHPGPVPNYSGFHEIGSNSTATNDFVMAGDDAVIIADSSNNSTFKNLVIWTTGGNGIQLGWNQGGYNDLVDGVDIIHFSGGNYAGTQAAIGAVAYCNAVNHPMNNVTVENVRVEGVISRVIGLATQSSAFCSIPAAAPVYNITFSNITSQQNGTNSSTIFGANSTATVHDVCLQNITIGGTAVTSSNSGSYFSIGGNTSNISFQGSGGCPMYSGSSSSGTWESPGGPIADSPAIASQGTNELDAFVRGTDGQLYQKTWTGSSWTTWSALGGPTNNTFQGAPAAISWGSGYLDVFVRGTDNALWHRWYRNGSWSSSWENLGGNLADSPAVTSQGNNELDVFIRDANGQLSQKTWTGSLWTGWNELGGPTGNTFQGAPTAASWGSGYLDVFVRGTDNAIWHRYYRNGWSSSWEDLGGSFASSPGVVAQGSDALDVFARGSDGQLYQEVWGGYFWDGWSPLGGPTGNTFQGTPAAISWGSGYLDVFVWGTDNALWHRWYRNGSWS